MGLPSVRERLVSIVVPTYNERQNLQRLVSAIKAHVPFSYEIIVVDDASPDGTADLARDLAREHRIRVISRPEKSGLGSAYRDGFRAARGDVIFEMDADLSHDPRAIPLLVAAVDGGADIAVGSRYVPGGQIVGWGAYRKAVSRVGNALARTLLPVGAHDMTSGYRCYSRKGAEIVQRVGSDGYAFQVEALFLAKKLGLRIVEVPITFENRTVGRSKLRAGEFGSFLGTILRLRMGLPTAKASALSRSRPTKAG